MKTITPLVFLLLCAPVFAQEESPPISQEKIAGAETGTLELDTVEVTSTLSVQQEAALRIVRQAMDTPRSYMRADRDNWRCWLERPPGTRLNYLHCARNGDLWARQPKPGGSHVVPRGGGAIGADHLMTPRYGDYGQILVSERPMNVGKLGRLLGNAPGDGANDHVFINMVLKGEKPTGDVPSEEELNLFAASWSELETLEARGVSEDDQVRAIQRRGLSLDRYNRIADWVEDSDYIRGEVAARVQAAN